MWNLTNCRLKTNHIGHTGYLNNVTVSPDGSLCASGGKDGNAMLWDLNEGKHLYTLDGGDIINALTFSPNRYWLCAATGPSIKIWVCNRLWLDITEVSSNSKVSVADRHLSRCHCFQAITQSLFYHSARQLHTYNIQKILSKIVLLRVNVRT